jgi:hypothetical protein
MKNLKNEEFKNFVKSIAKKFCAVKKEYRKERLLKEKE